jgi:hypothetical protein
MEEHKNHDIDMLSVERQTNVEEYEDPNAKWAHAISAEPSIKKKEAIAQLEYMKELFTEYLPLGEKTENISNYFNELEKIIYTKDDGIQYEEFDDSEPVPEDRRYRYNSASVFKKRSGWSADDNTHPQDVEYPTTIWTPARKTIQSQPSSIEPLQRLPDSPESADF